MNVHDTIKEKLDIIDIAEHYTKLSSSGRNGRVKGLCPLHQEKTPSFFVFGVSQRWHCFGCNRGGDVFDLYEELEHVDHATALKELARQAGVELQPPTPEQREQHARQRHTEEILGIAVAQWQRTLHLPNSAGMAYATGRGWDAETIESAGLGYHHDDAGLRNALQRANVDLESDAARAVLATPEKSLIYPHYKLGHVVYFAARGIEQKRHWNPPQELLGSRQLYYNHHYHQRAEDVIVIEGQGDAVTVGHWDMAAIGMAGTAIPDELIETLKERHKHVYIGVENNDAGRQAARKLAGKLGAMARLLYWPDDDANAWLISGATVEDLRIALKGSPTWLDTLIDEAAASEPADYEECLRRVFKSLVHVDQFILTKLQNEICQRLDLDKNTFTSLLKIARMEAGLDQHGRPLYEVIGGQICRRIYDRYGGESITPLAAFSAHIVEDILEDDGQEQVRHFVIEGKLPDGKRLPEVRVKADDFSKMNWVLPSWGTRAMVMAGRGTSDHLRAAIQTLSGDEVESRHEYAHLGWREIDGDMCYLHAGGAVGKKDITVRIHSDMERYRLPQYDPEATLDAVRASLRFLEIGEHYITIPLWASMYLAPLASILPPAFTVWLFGTTGSMKSTAAALAMCHYGHFSYNLPAPGSWTSSTAYALRVKAFLCKDAPLWVDDYAKQSTTSGERELRKLAETLLREWGNRSGRSAGQADGSLRTTHDPRGLVLSTAEQLPPNPSIHPRLYAVEIHPGDISHGPGAALTIAQNEEADLYPQAMISYLRWLAPQIQGDLRQRLKNRKHVLTEKARKNMGQHLRSPANVAIMTIGWEMGIHHAYSVGVIDAEQRDGWLQHGWTTLVELGEHQDEEINNEEDPIKMYYEAIEQMLTQGSIFLRHAEQPNDTSMDKPSMNHRSQNSEFLGWYDDNYYYLIDKVTYNAVRRFYHAGGRTFPDSSRGIKIKLLEMGRLHPNLSETYRYKMSFSGDQPWVLRIVKE